MYRMLLFVYPKQFRHNFGAEMHMVFGEQLRTAREHKDWLELLTIWRYALKDLLTVGLPMRSTDPLTVVAVLSVAVTSTVFIPLFWALQNPLALNTLARNTFSAAWR
jgi:hypothetical protein